jgi:acyl-CoA synthetase (AMP-forming)/AMP-acid ligase II
VADTSNDSESIVAILTSRAEHVPDRIAYTFLTVDRTETVTFAALDTRCRALAALLLQRGDPGDRVLVLLRPGLEYIAVFFAILYAGMIAVPVYPPEASKSEQGFLRVLEVLKDCGATLVVTHSTVAATQQSSDLAGALRARQVQSIAIDELRDAEAPRRELPLIDGTAIAFLQYTSGSTASPKGVRLTHGNVLANVRGICRRCRVTSESVVVGWLPPYHDMGLVGLILVPALGHGGTSVLMSPTAFLKKPVRWLAEISNHRGTHSAAPNFAYELCVKTTTPEQRASLDLGSWDVAISGAEPVRFLTLSRFAEAFEIAGFRKNAFLPCYGLAETVLLASSPPRGVLAREVFFDGEALFQGLVVEVDRSSSAAVSLVANGQPVDGHRILVLEEESETPKPDGHVGEIAISGPSVSSGYWNKPAAKRLHDGNDEFFRTGDLGFFHQGSLFITGRIRDLIKLGGKNYFAEELERFVEKSCDWVRAGCLAAFGVDEDGSTKLVLLAGLPGRDAGDERALTERVVELQKQVFATFGRAFDRVVLVSASRIPRTSSGKIQRHQCRRIFLDPSLPATLRYPA